MTTNSVPSGKTFELAKVTVTQDWRHRLTTSKTLLCLALPLTLAVGCASGPSHSVVTHPFTELPTVTNVSARQADNILVAKEISEMWMMDKQLSRASSISASVNEGVVTLGSNLPDGVERQRIAARIRELPGVRYVSGEPAELATKLAAGVTDSK